MIPSVFPVQIVLLKSLTLIAYTNFVYPSNHIGPCFPFSCSSLKIINFHYCLCKSVFAFSSVLVVTAETLKNSAISVCDMKNIYFFNFHEYSYTVINLYYLICSCHDHSGHAVEGLRTQIQ